MTGNSEIEFNLICEAVKIFLNGKIFSEMEILFKLVGISIELAVEILGDEPARVKQLFGAGEAERAEQQQNIQRAVRPDDPALRLRALRMNDVRHSSFHAVIVQQKCGSVNQTAK